MTQNGACLRAGVLLQKLGQDLVLMDVQSGHYFELNATGAAMLELMLAGADQTHVISAISARFDAPESRIGEDLAALQSQLQAQKLIAFYA
jgi:hypothetical protein